MENRLGAEKDDDDCCGIRLWDPENYIGVIILPTGPGSTESASESAAFRRSGSL